MQGVQRLLDIQEAVLKGGRRSLPADSPCLHVEKQATIEQPIVNAVLDGRLVDKSGINIYFGVRGTHRVIVVRSDEVVDATGHWRYYVGTPAACLYQGNSAAAAVAAMLATTAPVQEATLRGGRSGKMPPGSPCLKVPGLVFDPRLCDVVTDGVLTDITSSHRFVDSAIFVRLGNTPTEARLIISAMHDLAGNQVYGTYNGRPARLKVHTTFDTVLPLIQLGEAVARGGSYGEIEPVQEVLLKGGHSQFTLMRTATYQHNEEAVQEYPLASNRVEAPSLISFICWHTRPMPGWTALSWNSASTASEWLAAARAADADRDRTYRSFDGVSVAPLPAEFEAERVTPTFDT